MVFKYRRKTDRGSSWDDESMRQAFHAVRVEKKGIRQAAAQFRIPYPTLRKHLIKDKPTQVNTNISAFYIHLNHSTE